MKQLLLPLLLVASLAGICAQLPTEPAPRSTIIDEEPRPLWLSPYRPQNYHSSDPTKRRNYRYREARKAGRLHQRAVHQNHRDNMQELRALRRQHQQQRRYLHRLGQRTVGPSHDQHTH